MLASDWGEKLGAVNLVNFDEVVGTCHLVQFVHVQYQDIRNSTHDCFMCILNGDSVNLKYLPLKLKS